MLPPDRHVDAVEPTIRVKPKLVPRLHDAEGGKLRRVADVIQEPRRRRYLPDGSHWTSGRRHVGMSGESPGVAPQQRGVERRVIIREDEKVAAGCLRPGVTRVMEAQPLLVEVTE